MVTLSKSFFLLFFYEGEVYNTDLGSARVAMIIQPTERNIFDQRWIEYTLFKK